MLFIVWWYVTKKLPLSKFTASIVLWKASTIFFHLNLQLQSIAHMSSSQTVLLLCGEEEHAHMTAREKISVPQQKNTESTKPPTTDRQRGDCSVNRGIRKQSCRQRFSLCPVFSGAAWTLTRCKNKDLEILALRGCMTWYMQLNSWWIKGQSFVRSFVALAVQPACN